MSKHRWSRPGRISQQGQGAVEYALLIALVAVGLVLSLNLMGISVSELYCSVARNFGGSATCGAPGTPQVYCEDTFDKKMSGWDTLGGEAETEHGKMCFEKYLQSLNKCSMKSDKSDYVVKMEGVTLDKGDGYGVFFRTSNDKNGLDGYVFQYDPGMKAYGYPNGALLIRRWINGVEVWTPVAIAPMSATNTFKTKHDIAIDVKGNVFTVTMDGNKVLTGTDDTYKTGGTGLRSWDSTSACLNGFSVSESSQ